MLAFLKTNFYTIIVLIVLALIVGLIIRGIIRDNKSGKGHCGGDCSHCHGACYHNEKK